MQVAPAFQQLLAPYNVRFVRGSVASVEPQETMSDGSTASGARNFGHTSCAATVGLTLTSPELVVWFMVACSRADTESTEVCSQ
jgi:hypothetical protein